MREPDELGWVIGLSALFGIVLAIVIVASTRQGLHPGVLQIGPDYVGSRDLVLGTGFALPYGELWVAHKEGRGNRESLVFKNRENGRISIRTALLPDAGAADAALAAVRERIGALPDGPQRLEGISARQAVAERLRSGRRIVAPTVSVLLGLVFLAELATGALSDPIRLYAFGANSSFLVFGGELFRLATANLLHASLTHLLFNVMALISLGVLLEPLLGPARFLTVFLVSAVAGAAGSVLLGQHALSLGASTGIAGLVGAYAVVLQRWPDRFSRPTTRRIWISVALALFLWPELIGQKNVDLAAHLAGLLAGLAMMYLELREEDLLALAGRRRAQYQALAVLLVALFGAACWTAVWHARDHDRVLTDAALAARDPALSPPVRNELVWRLVTSPAVSRDHLWHALRGIESVVKNEPGEDEYGDTEATAHYRLGHWEEAVVTEHELFAADRKPFYAAQLARFEWALRKARGPLLLGEPPKVLPRAAIAPGSIFLDAGDAQLPAGSLVHLVLAREGKAIALVEVVTGGRETRPLYYPLPGNIVPEPDQAVLALVDTRRPGVRGETSWEILPVVPEVARLP
ncbi:MAG TPA: rhomboid family intramembrane serine protease [Thermoanaerobaculia bacterium]|nr:rhomboid family intramembrane serine protease [Thermoanaerobaculia bacterium]